MYSRREFLMRIMRTGMVLLPVTKFDSVTQIYMLKSNTISPFMEMNVYLAVERLLETEWANHVGIHRLHLLIL